jgi:hypothetical protein
MNDAILIRAAPQRSTKQVRLCGSTASSLCRDGGEGFGSKASGTCNRASAPAKDATDGPGLEANLALIQTIFGKKSRPISTLTQLLQTPYSYLFQQAPITPGPFKARSTLGSVAQQSTFPKAMRGKAVVNPCDFFGELNLVWI